MKRSLGAAAVFILALSCVPAKSVTVTGVGTQSCQSWSDAHVGATMTSDDLASSWILGYLDGLSALASQHALIKGDPQRDLLSQLDGPAIIKLVNIYCAGHPERKIQQAAAEVGAQLIAEDRPVKDHLDRRPSTATAVVVQPTRIRRETTGSGDIAGSIRTIAPTACRVVVVSNSGGETLHRLRKCD